MSVLSTSHGFGPPLFCPVLEGRNAVVPRVRMGLWFRFGSVSVSESRLFLDLVE